MSLITNPTMIRNKTVKFDFFEEEEAHDFDNNFRAGSNTSIDSLFDKSASTSTLATPSLSRNQSQVNNFEEAYDEDIFTQLRVSLGRFRHSEEKLVVMMVGLPASGKSTLCKQFNSFVNNQTEYVSRIYNAGDVRRVNSTFNNSEFFNPNYEQGIREREMYADMNVNNLLKDLSQNKINVGFLDATNTTVERRKRMIGLLKKSNAVSDIAIMDVQCIDERLLNFNISGKAHNMDYQDKDYKTSIADFKMRAKHYYKIYQPIEQEELNSYSIQMYIKVINGGQTIEQNLLDSNFSKAKLFETLSRFTSGYYNNEGKRYMAAADLFYKNN